MQDNPSQVPVYPEQSFLAPLASPTLFKAFEFPPDIVPTQTASDQGWRSIETPRNETLKLPESGFMKDLYCEISQGYGCISGGNGYDPRCSFGSSKGRDEEIVDGNMKVFEESETVPDKALMCDFSSEDIINYRTSSGAVPQEQAQHKEPTDETDDSATTKSRKASLESAFVTDDSSIPFEVAAPKQPHAEKKSGKKCCNCKMSMCLKLYCECFAAGQYCEGCNCVSCHNLSTHESERKAAFTKISKKNPAGYKRRMALQESTVEQKVKTKGSGCNCSKSGCRKNYCECYKMGVICGASCSCEGCRNLKLRRNRAIRKKK